MNRRLCRLCREPLPSRRRPLEPRAHPACQRRAVQKRLRARQRARMVRPPAAPKLGRGWSAIRARILRRDEDTCRFCGRMLGEVRKLVVDHLWPRALGGGDDDGNTVTLCERDHAKAKALIERALYRKSDVSGLRQFAARCGVVLEIPA